MPVSRKTHPARSRVRDPRARLSISLWHVFAVFALAALAGCAEGSPLGDAANTNNAPADVSSPDTNPTDTAGDGVEDSGGGDASEVVDACGVCCPGQRRCADASGLEVCRDDGSGFKPADSCRDGFHCVAGKCQREPICEPGDQRCKDASTLLICRDDGLSRRPRNCQSGTVCVQGKCRHGSPNGATCAKDADCAGGVCVCAGSNAGMCAADVQPFCASSCNQTDCGGEQVCLRSAKIAGLNQDVCVADCQKTNCSKQTACLSLPTRSAEGGNGWQKGCFFDEAKGVGERCAKQDARCIGGTCLRDYFHVDACVPRCEGACPEGTACVKLKDQQFYCSPLCGDGSFDSSEPCPLEAEENSNETTCNLLDAKGGGLKRACDSI